MANNSTAQKIRTGLKDKIIECYNADTLLYIVAHSLVSVYLFDVINELISDSDDLLEWPVQRMITIGCPLGLAMCKVLVEKQLKNLEKDDITLNG